MKPEIREEEVMFRARQLIGELLRDDVPPIVIAYAFTYVAAELGLSAEKDARKVLATLLGTMARATADAVPESHEVQATDHQVQVPAGITKQ